jgi:hypothetical protein
MSGYHAIVQVLKGMTYNPHEKMTQYPSTLMTRSNSLVPMASITLSHQFASSVSLTIHPVSVMAVNIMKSDQPTISFKLSKENTRTMQPDSSSFHLMPSTNLATKANATKSDLPTINLNRAVRWQIQVSNPHQLVSNHTA